MTVTHNFKPQMFVTVSRYHLVDPASFTDHQKQCLWSGIKQKNPALADLLKQDEGIEALKNAFNARVVFELAEFNEYINGNECGI